MKIRDVRCAGLRGATPEGGWSVELKPEDCVHTLVVVHTELVVVKHVDVILVLVVVNDRIIERDD
jgi:hypothetical protein